MTNDGTAFTPVSGLPRGLTAGFVENLGQMGSGAGLFYIEGSPVSVSFGEGWFAYDHHRDGRGSMVRVEFVDANQVKPRGERPTCTRSSHLVGKDPSHWVRNARSFEQVRYDGLWDGVDLQFRLDGGGLKYDLVLEPGSNPSAVRFRYVGALDLQLEPGSGDLSIRAPTGFIRDQAPKAYQRGAGHDEMVSVEFSLFGGAIVGFLVGDYDHGRTLVIDPGIGFSTFIGGPDSDWATDLCLDDSGDILVTGLAATGTTTTGQFPTTPGAYDTCPNGTLKGQYAVVLRLSPDGSRLLFSTLLGGSSSDKGKVIKPGENGTIWVFGETYSEDFPTTAGACDSSHNGYLDIFIARLTADGSDLLYASYFGGSNNEDLGGAIVGEGGCVHLTGGSWSVDLPTTNGAYDNKNDQYSMDVYVAKLTADGSSLVYSTYVGGTKSERGRDIALDARGRAVIAGMTYDRDFPVTEGAFNSTRRGSSEVFVLSLDTNGSSVVFSSVLATSQEDEPWALELDGEGNILVVGETDYGEGFPKVWGSYRSPNTKGTDAFVVRMTPNASALEFSCVLGGKGTEVGQDLALTQDGHVVIVGRTTGRGFPTSEDAANRSTQGYYDIFLSELHAEGTTLVHSTLLGGKDYDSAMGLATGGRHVLVCGSTGSKDFPATQGAYCATFTGRRDHFVLRYELPDPDTTPPEVIGVEAPDLVRTHQSYKVHAEVADDRGIHNVTVWTWCSNNTTRHWRLMRYVEGNRTGSKYWSWVGIYSDWPGTFHIVVEVTDTSGNVNASDPVSVPMVDGIGPRIEWVWPPPTATTGDSYNITVNVTDNFGVESVYCLYTKYDYGHPKDWANITMVAVNVTATGNGTYLAQVPGDYLDWQGTLVLRFGAMDTDGNLCEYYYARTEVLDDDPPLIEDLSPSVATTGDAYVFKARVKDNIGLAGVKVSYALGSVAPLPREQDMEVPREGGVLSSRPFYIPADFLGRLNYTIRAIDVVGNIAVTAERWVQVVDNDPPTLDEDLSDGSAETGRPFHLQLSGVRDNIDVAQVSVLYSFEEGRPGTVRTAELEGRGLSGGGNDTYQGAIMIPEDLSNRLSYAIEVLDPAGNRMVTSWVRIVVRDIIPPEFLADLTGPVAYSGMMHTIRVKVRDNVGLERVSLSFWFAEGQRSPDQMLKNKTVWYKSLMIPVNAEGSLNYELVAIDLSGNKVYSGTRQVEVTNPAPWVVQPIVWTVIEDDRSDLDLAPFLRDENDALTALSVACDHPNVTVSGHRLWASYPRWVPDHQVKLLVSDGETTINATVLVKVVPVNHPPTVRVVSFRDGAVYQEGEMVPLQAIVSDPDINEGQELDMTWSSNVSGRLLTYALPGDPSTAGVRLPPGAHLIRVTVSDGVEEATDAVAIMVMPVAEPPAPDTGHDDRLAGGSDGAMQLVLVVASTLSLGLLVAMVIKARTRLERS